MARASALHGEMATGLFAMWARARFWRHRHVRRRALAGEASLVYPTVLMPRGVRVGAQLPSQSPAYIGLDVGGARL